jgi:predicted DNA-binding transcriptional regulator YafY
VSRSARLFSLLDALRRRRRPVTAAVLAGELGVTVRTIYRDVGTLVGLGAPIEGEAGIGYVLRPGFLMPPLMFDEEEAEALVLGLGLVIERGDDELGVAAEKALGRILDVMPPALRDRAEGGGLMAGPVFDEDWPGIDVSLLRDAIRDETKLVIDYGDGVGQRSTRTIWPVTLAYFARSEVLVAWCELRADYRSFRADRILSVTPIPARYPRRRAILLAEWRRREGLAD